MTLKEAMFELGNNTPARFFNWLYKIVIFIAIIRLAGELVIYFM
jgi:hypothetical protein